MVGEAKHSGRNKIFKGETKYSHVYLRARAGAKLSEHIEIAKQGVSTNILYPASTTTDRSAAHFPQRTAAYKVLTSQ